VIVDSMVKRNFKDFTKSRFFRLVPTYWLITLMSFLLSFFTVRSIDYELLAKSILGLNFVLGEHALIPAAWTLAVEIQFYVIASIFFKIRKYPNSWQIFCATYLFCALAIQIFGERPLSLIAIWQFGPLFVLGITIRYDLRKSSIDATLISVSSLMSMKSLSDRLIAWNSINFKCAISIASLTVGIFILVAMVRVEENSRLNPKGKIKTVILYLSKLTYPFYLLHENFGEGVISICYQLVRNSYLAWAISLGVCLLLSAGVLRFVELAISRYSVHMKIKTKG